MFFTVVIWLAMGGLALLLAYLAGFSWISRRDRLAVAPDSRGEWWARQSTGLWRKGELPAWR